MRVLFLLCLPLLLGYSNLSQEAGIRGSTRCNPRSSDYHIECTSKKITVFLNAKYDNIDSYTKDIIKISDSPSHKKWHKNIVDLFATRYKSQVKYVIDSYGINAKGGTFIIKSDGKLEAVSFYLHKDNTYLIPKHKARRLFDELSKSIVFPSCEDDTVCDCIFVGLFR